MRGIHHRWARTHVNGQAQRFEDFVPRRALLELTERVACHASTNVLAVSRSIMEVAVEQGWDAEEFLKHACLKAGLHARAWQDPETEVEVFEAEEFGGEPVA